MSASDVASAYAAKLRGGEAVVPVEIVRPKTKGAATAGRLIAFFGMPWLNAWILMLIADHFGLRWSYWDGMLAVIAARVIRPFSHDYDLWTRGRKS